MTLKFNKKRGQYLTKDESLKVIVRKLIKNKSGKAFEPSAGIGDLVQILEEFNYLKIDAIEIEKSFIENKICNTKIQEKNFFVFINENKTEYNTIVANPPFVKLKNLSESDLKYVPKDLYPFNSNLLYFFIEFCISILAENGELIFIVPKEFLYNFSATRLRKIIHEHGNMTHIIECSDIQYFSDANLETLIIFRFEKTKSKNNKLLYYQSVQDFLNEKYIKKMFGLYNNLFFMCDSKLYEIISKNKDFNTYFDIKVGSIVTGKDSIFKLSEGNTNNIENNCILDVITTKKIKEKFINAHFYDCFDDIPNNTKQYLLNNKNELINRKIHKFNEFNWWKYGTIRNYEILNSDLDRILCVSKTRKRNYFWVGNSNQMTSGGVLALFPRKTMIYELNDVVMQLNTDIYRHIFDAFFLITGNKISFTKTVLEQLPFIYK